MKLGVSLAKTTCLPRMRSAKAAKGRQQAAVGLRGGDDFKQPHVARRIEEMRAEEAVAVAGEGLRDAADGQAGGVGRQQRLGRQVRQDARQQRGFDFEILGDGFDDPVAVGQLRRDRRRSCRA